MGSLSVFSFVWFGRIIYGFVAFSSKLVGFIWVVCLVWFLQGLVVFDRIWFCWVQFASILIRFNSLVTIDRVLFGLISQVRIPYFVLFLVWFSMIGL